MPTSSTIPVNLKSDDGVFKLKHESKNHASLYQNDKNIANLGVYGFSAYWYLFSGALTTATEIKLVAEFIREVSYYTEKDSPGSFSLTTEGKMAHVYRGEDLVASVSELGDVILHKKVTTRKKWWGLRTVTYTERESLHEFAIRLIDAHLKNTLKL
jgi:hypothetical protein